jgi:peptidoglycan DL-endopeptidase CwlO
LVAVPAVADPRIQAKQAQAQQVLGQLDRLSASLEQTQQQYDYAQVKYERIQRDLRTNRVELRVAKKNLQVGQKRIAARLVALYTEPKDSTLEVILGAKSLDDLLNRVNTARSVTSQDADVLQQVQRFKTVVKRSGDQLVRERAEAKRLLEQQAAKKRQFQGQLAEQHRLLDSIKGQIAQIQAQDQRRALAAAEAARARLSAEQHAQTLAAQSQIVGVTAAAPSSDTSTDPTTVAVAAPTSSVGGGAVGMALSEVGKPYVWAASGPDSFDCSGLVAYAYAAVGVSLPHSSYAQWDMGVPVSKDELQPGDLVFFDGLGHVGMYVGGGQFVHAPHTGTDVQVSDLNSGWYAASYVGARRILG